uniref:Coiled-coil serine-rich protein 1 n=1 Tax=Monopterus albus TaxID=43700 RepID=A0A3Q3JH47_MONAL
MGESGSRRSTLVSRLPIFRRSSSKRQESLPSSPSSGGVGNGVHTSSPSSTNSSSGSTGKRRSLFSTSSLSFTSKQNSDPRVQPINLNLTPPLTQGTDANGNNKQTIPTSVSTGFIDGGGRPKSRHSFGFGSHRQKKITQSQTKDFDKGSSSSSTANRNVFINCISSSGTNEGDDSGFLDDYSGSSNNNKRSSRQKKQSLLPKSFSVHHRFSRTSDHHRPPEVNLEPPSSTTMAPGPGGLTPGSWPGELLGTVGQSSLQSPMISEDQTTAITPSEFIPVTEDSVSEVDALPAPSPGSGLSSGPASVPVQSSTEKPLLPDTSTANNTDYDTAVSLSEPETAVPYRKVGYQTETTSESEACQSERRPRHTLSFQERGSFCGCHEPRSSHLRKPHAASLCSSVSPYHEVMRMERRLRSSSEGAGGPRIHGNHRDAPGMEGCGLLKHRNNSSSSKLGSLDVLNNLGSSELDEDDLMLDLDLSDDQRHRHGNLFTSTETSPASSLQSLPISPCSEKSLPFKDLGREEALMQQLREKDELILKLQSELVRSGSGPAAANHTTTPSPSFRQPEGASSSSESLTLGGGGVSLSCGVRRGGGEHPPSHIPRAVGASTSSSLHSLASRGSPSASRLGQPPRGPLSLHSYSRKNVFLQHSLHTAELQALTQRDS